MMLKKNCEESFNRTHDRCMDHNNAFFFTSFIGTRKIKSLRKINIELYGCYLPLTTKRIFGHKVCFWSIKRCFAWRLHKAYSPASSEIAKCIFCLYPKFLSTQIFFKMLWVMKRQTYTKLFETRSWIKCINNIPNFQKFVLYLGFATKYMCIVLCNCTH